MDRDTWQDTVHGITWQATVHQDCKVGHDLVTKPPQQPYFGYLLQVRDPRVCRVNGPAQGLTMVKCLSLDRIS